MLVKVAPPSVDEIQLAMVPLKAVRNKLSEFTPEHTVALASTVPGTGGAVTVMVVMVELSFGQTPF